MRYVKVRFIRSNTGEKLPRATLTYIDKIPDDAWEDIMRWVLTGEGKFGKAEKYLTINIIVTKNFD